MTPDPRMALVHELLQQADPPDLPARSHVWTQGGKADRYQVIPQLAATFIQIHQLAVDERAA